MNLCKTSSILVPRQCNGNSIILRRQEKVAQNAEIVPRNAKDVICVRVCRTFGPAMPTGCVQDESEKEADEQHFDIAFLFHSTLLLLI